MIQGSRESYSKQIRQITYQVYHQMHFNISSIIINHAFHLIYIYKAAFHQSVSELSPDIQGHKACVRMFVPPHTRGRKPLMVAAFACIICVWQARQVSPCARQLERSNKHMQLKFMSNFSGQLDSQRIRNFLLSYFAY